MKKLFYYKTFPDVVGLFVNKHNLKKEDIQCITFQYEKRGYVYIYYWAEENLDLKDKSSL